MDTPTETRDASTAIRAALAAPLPSPVIAVDGRSGSGKTEFAALLARHLGAGARLFHLEDVYPGWDGLLRGCERAVGPIAALASGRAARLPTWDWERDREGPLLPLPPLGPGEILVVEGCGAFAEPLGALSGSAIWCEAPQEVRRARTEERDAYDWSSLWDAWAAQEDRLVYARRPDVVLRTG